MNCILSETAVLHLQKKHSFPTSVVSSWKLQGLLDNSFVSTSEDDEIIGAFCTDGCWWWA